MRTDVRRSGGFFAVALICAFAVAPAVAQDAADTPSLSDAPVAIAPASDAPASDSGIDYGLDAPVSPEDSALIGNILVFDPASIAGAAPAKSLRLPGLGDSKSFDVSGTGNPDGTGTVVLRKPLPSVWDAKVGADLDFGTNSADPYRGNPLSAPREGNGAAWASVGVPDLATVDARVDPRSDQGKLGTTFSHSVPIGSKFSVTLQNSYSVTETYGQPQAAPSDIPLMAAPVTDPAAPTPRIFGKEGVAKFNILPTGTTLGAGLSATNVDPVTHNTLSAEQKLYGPLNVTTSVTDVGQPYSSKSLTAGFKLSW